MFGTLFLLPHIKLSMITWNDITATLRIKSRRISRISYHLCYFNINFQFILTKGRSFICYEIDQDSEIFGSQFQCKLQNRTKGKKESTFIYLNLDNYVFANRFGTNDTRRLVHLWRKHWDDLHTGISADILYVSSARTGIIAY